MLLAAFVPARPGERVLDLGCGAGAAALCLAARVAGLELHGLEIQPAYAALARRNAAANGTALAVHDGDVRRPPPALRALAFDQVLANPPFHGPRPPPPPIPGRDTALREGEATLADWIDAGLRRLRPGGALALVHRPTASPASSPPSAPAPARSTSCPWPAGRRARDAPPPPRRKGSRGAAPPVAALNPA